MNSKGLNFGLIVLTLLFSFSSCKKENQLPSCTITYPNNGDEFEQGDIIAISVEANDNDGLIADVNFYIDDIGTFSSSTFPYKYSWNTLDETIGDHIIKVTAKDNEGGSQIDECTISIINTVTDIDGNIYKIVIIGNQVWMAENLKVTKYKNGAAIPLVTDNTAWSNLSTPGYCWYDNDEATYGDTYGALYNWYTVNAGNLCPTGWHVSTHAEWTTLETYLEGSSDAGGKMKEAGTSHWNSPNTGAANESGFTALPGAYRSSNGTFYNIGFIGWWSSTEFSVTSAWPVPVLQ